MTSIVEQAAAIGMTEEQVNAIMGSLLGDASLRKSSDHTQCIRWNHGQVQEDYVIHKYNLLSEFATRPPFVTENPGYGDFWVVLTLKALPIFYSMYTLLRPAGSERKTITVDFLNEITHPIALAWWFMDDGSRDQNNNCAPQRSTQKRKAQPKAAPRITARQAAQSAADNAESTAESLF